MKKKRTILCSCFFFLFKSAYYFNYIIAKVTLNYFAFKGTFIK